MLTWIYKYKTHTGHWQEHSLSVRNITQYLLQENQSSYLSDLVHIFSHKLFTKVLYLTKVLLRSSHDFQLHNHSLNLSNVQHSQTC